MLTKQFKYLLIILLISFIFFIAVIIDLTPFLRGPAPYPPEWQYAYFFVNTLNKIWAAFIVGIIIYLLWVFLEKKDSKFIEKKERLLILLIIVLSFIFQISILYFGRAGIGVMLQRIIDPGMNSYFSASLQINNLGHFLSNYNDTVLSYGGHARGHTPGNILFYWILNNFFSFTPLLFELVENFSPSRVDVQSLWFSLSSSQKIGAFVSGFIIVFLSNFTLALLYYLGKHLYGIKTGLRSIFLYIFVPSFILFIPMHDVIFVLFSVSSVLLFIKGLYLRSYSYLFYSGFILSVGLFFSLSLLPVFLIIFILYIFNLFKNITALFNKWLNMGLYAFFGMILFPIIIYILFDFNIIEVGRTIMSGLAPRSYTVWLFYNAYDFFIFSGIPVLILFAILTKNFIFGLLKKKWSDIDPFFIAIIFTLLILDISGATRAETSRIWLPIVPFLILLVSKFITVDLKFSKSFFFVIMFIQFIQILVFQEFWVMLW